MPVVEPERLPAPVDEDPFADAADAAHDPVEEKCW
jgi:hypothetical protein